MYHCRAISSLIFFTQNFQSLIYDITKNSHDSLQPFPSSIQIQPAQSAEEWLYVHQNKLVKSIWSVWFSASPICHLSVSLTLKITSSQQFSLTLQPLEDEQSLHNPARTSQVGLKTLFFLFKLTTKMNLNPQLQMAKTGTTQTPQGYLTDRRLVEQDNKTSIAATIHYTRTMHPSLYQTTVSDFSNTPPDSCTC